MTLKVRFPRYIGRGPDGGGRGGQANGSSIQPQHTPEVRDFGVSSPAKDTCDSRGFCLSLCRVRDVVQEDLDQEDLDREDLDRSDGVVVVGAQNLLVSPQDVVLVMSVGFVSEHEHLASPALLIGRTIAPNVEDSFRPHVAA